MKSSLYIKTETRDEKGRLLHRMRMRRGRSFVQGYNWAICAQFLGSSNPSPVLGPVKDTGGTNRNLRTCGASFRSNGGVGVTSTGIRVGASDAAVAIGQHALQSPIGQGSGAGQLLHQAQSFNFIGVADNQCSFATQRVFVNNSGAQVAVRETALYMEVFYPTTSAYIMVARDLISEDVPDGGSVTVVYTIRIVA